MARARGFSFIEVMVVLAIVGILAGLVVGSLRPDPGRAVVAEAWRLARLVERLGREAELTGAVLALRWDEGGYAFLRRADAGGWTALPDDGVFGARRFAAGLRLSDTGEALFIPDEDRAPLTLSLQGEGARASVRVSALGEAVVVQDAAPPPGSLR